MPNPVKIESCLNSSSEKIIKDVIYGYISIPRVIIEDFVDTKYFQRLRGVEQTNTSVIFPSATHTRFSHSLGVFNLAKNAFHWLIENTSSEIIQNKAEFKKSYLTTVWIASLLHDIGHAPFSHICEGFFCLAGNDYYLDQFFQVLPSLRQDYDIAVSTGRKPAPHEL
ncbi:HD domain-containing protein, partial [bacterium]|nr:HD domain-containing protein [bacterium]